MPIRPGTYGALALGMANVIINSGLYDEDFVRDFTFGFEDFARRRRARGTRASRAWCCSVTRSSRVSAITGVAGGRHRPAGRRVRHQPPGRGRAAGEPRGLDGGDELGTALAIHALNALVGSIDARAACWSSASRTWRPGRIRGRSRWPELDLAIRPCWLQPAPPSLARPWLPPVICRAHPGRPTLPAQCALPVQCQPGL